MMKRTAPAACRGRFIVHCVLTLRVRKRHHAERDKYKTLAIRMVQQFLEPAGQCAAETDRTIPASTRPTSSRSRRCMRSFSAERYRVHSYQ